MVCDFILDEEDNWWFIQVSERNRNKEEIVGRKRKERKKESRGDEKIEKQKSKKINIRTVNKGWR